MGRNKNQVSKKRINMYKKQSLSTLLFAGCIAFASCDKNDNETAAFDTSGSFMLKDQSARPGINTVFVSSADKDQFNQTLPSQMAAAFKAKFNSKLLALNPGYTTNALGLNADQFTTVLVTDVLNVKMNGTTTFFDGTNVLTGRALADDVIDTELLLIFGGPSGTANVGLTKDNVNANDKPFLNTFPYLANPH
jgi:hypothetical protein